MDFSETKFYDACYIELDKVKWYEDQPPKIYYLQLHRLEPQSLKGHLIGGFLKLYGSHESWELCHWDPSYKQPKNLPSLKKIIEETRTTYGGGIYQLQIEDENYKRLENLRFDIAGLPKLQPHQDENSLENQTLRKFKELWPNYQYDPSWEGGGFTFDVLKNGCVLGGFGFPRNLQRTIRGVSTNLGSGPYDPPSDISLDTNDFKERIDELFCKWGSENTRREEELEYYCAMAIRIRKICSCQPGDPIHEARINSWLEKWNKKRSNDNRF